MRINKKRFYRKFRLDVPREEVEKTVAEGMDPEKYSHTPLAGPYSPPDVDDLVGKTLAIRGEEKNYDIRVTGLNELYLKEEGEEEKDAEHAAGRGAAEGGFGLERLGHFSEFRVAGVPGYRRGKRWVRGRG